MHRITNITIENFKSIVNGRFPLAAYTPLVGYNNAGKTNILRAASWLIKKHGLPSSEFFDSEQPITVMAEIAGVTQSVLETLEEKHRQRIEPIIDDEQIRIRRSQLIPDAKATDLKLEVWKSNDKGEKDWEVNPTGIDAAITHLFPEPIFIGAMENATEDVGKFATGTTIGKLIREIIGPVTDEHSGPVNEALAEIAKKLSADGPEKDKTLLDLDEQIQNELNKFFPGVSAKTHIPTPEFSDFLKGATIRIFEDAYEDNEGREASSFGHGAQRSVQIALIKCLSERKRAAADDSARTTLLLIDEPELYLHPQAIELVRASLGRLSSEGYQVLFSTHSPNMIARQDAQNALLIRRNAVGGTTAFPRLSDAVQEAIANAEHQSETLFTLTNSTKLLFCEKAVLAEGKTERALLPEIYRYERGVTLDEDKVGLIELGGVDNVPNAMTVLDTMGIPTKSVVDLDFAFRGAVTNGFFEENDTALTGCKAVFQRLADAGQIAIDPINALPQGGNGVTASVAFAIMAAEPDAQPHIETIHNQLLANQIWCWSRGSIEAHLGLTSKKPSAHLAFLNSLGNQTFRSELPDYLSVQALIDWLNE